MLELEFHKLSYKPYFEKTGVQWCTVVYRSAQGDPENMKKPPSKVLIFMHGLKNAMMKIKKILGQMYIFEVVNNSPLEKFS